MPHPHKIKDKTHTNTPPRTEHLNAKKKHATLKKTLPLKIPNLTYNRIILPSRRFELFLLWQLSWFNIFKFLLLYLTNPPPAITLISSLALGPRGLTNLALDTLTHSPAEISRSLSLLLSSSPSSPTIIHCTQGKDRTGLVVILVLLVLSVPGPAIEHDYHLTSTTDPLIRNIRLSEVREVGLPDSFADTHLEMVQGVIAWLDEKYGGVEGYLDEINFGHLKRQRLREVLGYYGLREDEKPNMSESIGMLDSPSETSIQMEKSETSI
ncbi:protein-tyrosine phosphatase-like protein [Triangularia verruculosa]|uniref:Protein-tyrosine phosphatase-like protein n=1 Tax=Triangularia verruculosa TaxID=2587418 RepID=A0AAN6XNS7_9PEZI|nr:protein-tyrosine phosphatase-like protein [Triangularia verruculosa]